MSKKQAPALFYLGIDIAKLTFDAALLYADDSVHHKHLPNQEGGFEQLVAWLKAHKAQDLHICMEATGHYGKALATFLWEKGLRVSVVNPAGPHAFARSQLSRTKTDKADAARIARFCRSHKPYAWQPTAPPVEDLQALVRRLDTLERMKQMETNRQDSTPAIAQFSLEAVLATLETQIALVKRLIHQHIDQHPDLKQQSQLLDSIPGVGPDTAARLLSELGNWHRFASAREAAAYAGLVPSIWESGTSVKARSRLCKVGNAHLRKSLYFPAMNALRFNPVVLAMAQRLRAAGKTEMAILGAAMRRLVHLAYGVLKSGKPFDASVAMRAASACP